MFLYTDLLLSIMTKVVLLRVTLYAVLLVSSETKKVSPPSSASAMSVIFWHTRVIPKLNVSGVLIRPLKSLPAITKENKNNIIICNIATFSYVASYECER